MDPWIAPMSAVAGDLPTDDQGWAYEPKWDGMRALIRVDNGVVQGRSRTAKDIVPAFPELDRLARVAPHVLLDGEIVALDASGRSSFALLQQRFGLSGHRAELARAETPTHFVVFDLLLLDEIEVWRLPYHQRRELLEDLIEEGPGLQISPSGVGGGEDWLAGARKLQLEGVMAKRVNSPYQPGKRSPDWRKIKIRHAQEFLVCGWTPGTGRRADSLGALVLGCHRAGQLTWVGNVGTGLTDADLQWWTRELAATATADCPFAEVPRDPTLRHAAWARPTHVVQVAYGEWTPDHRLRQPSLLGRRPDVAAESVRCEE